MVTTKHDLRDLIEALPASEWQTTRRFLEYLRDQGHDPVLHAFVDAPEEDEPITEEEAQAVAEARRRSPAAR